MLEGWERKHQLQEGLLEESYGFRKFYQAMLLKMVRDMKLLESSPETMQKFRTINETLEVHKVSKGNRQGAGAHRTRQSDTQPYK